MSDDIDAILNELDEEDNVEERHADEISAVEDKYDGDKIERKMAKKLEALESKFETNALRTAIESYESKADELEKALFDEVKADLKNIDDYERTVKFISDRAEKLKAREAQLAEEADKRAEEAAAKAWGTGPIGKRAPASTDEEKELMDRIGGGDVNALVEAVVGDNVPW